MSSTTTLVSSVEEHKSHRQRRAARSATPPPWAELLTVDQVGELLQISRRAVWRLTEMKLLNVLKVGGARRWRRSDLMAYIAGLGQ